MWRTALCGHCGASRRRGLELVSVSDSAEVRTVSHEYAADYLHLAYASTIHGIQGETTDASIVGPGMDAAGLYVGMTRGRAHNEAIAIARTDAAARDAIAESMLRGSPEVSIDDSIRAARTELGRAARNAPPDTDTAPAAWHNRARRPWGHVVDIERAVTIRRERETEMRERLQRINDWMHTTRLTLLDLDATVGRRDAAAHGRAPASGDEARPVEDSRRQLAERYALRIDDQARLAKEYRALSRETDEVEAERAVRTALDSRARATEDQARMRAADTAGVTTPVPSANGLRR